MRPRTELQQILETTLGSRNVYFQPPENLKLKYPCIIYERVGDNKQAADNLAYLKYMRYKITYIDLNPDSEMITKIPDAVAHCSYDGHMVVDNLNHDSFTAFF